MNYLGIDWGEKRIGLSLADGETKIATPFKTVGNIAEIEKIAKSEEIDLIVVGAPYSISNPPAGGQFPISKKFKKFISDLKSKTSAQVEFEDERLSSKAADALAGTKKTKAGRDEIAAMIILQSYLDKM